MQLTIENEKLIPDEVPWLVSCRTRMRDAGRTIGDVLSEVEVGFRGNRAIGK